MGRLFLDNIPHVKTHWPMVTPFLSQIALSFGCDDVEGTVVYERIYHEAGAHTDMHLPYMDLVRLIRGAGKRPVERDSLYQAVRESFDDPPPAEPIRLRARGARAARGARRMRLGRIPWINCYPIYGAIDRGLVSVPAELVTGTASELNDLLAAGELQVSVVSAVEYARNAAAYHLLPDLAITCDGPVHSVALFSKRPVDELDGLHGAAHRLLPHLGPAARAALPPPLGRRAAVRHRAGRGRRPRARSRGCRTRRCWSSATPRCCSRRKPAYPVRRGPGRGVEGLDRPAVRVRGLGRAAGGRRRPAVRRCTSGCSSRGPGAWPTWTSWRRPPRSTPGWPRRSAGRISATWTTRCPTATWPG